MDIIKPIPQIICGVFLSPRKYFRIKKILALNNYSFKNCPSTSFLAFLKYKKCSSFLMWGTKYKSKIIPIITDLKKPLITAEDGFIRSIGLGKALAMPLSMVFDKTGIYFDPRTPSDLENILNKINLNSADIIRINNILEVIKHNNITKYNSEKINPLKITTKQKIILVPGQVENDASIITGTKDINTNYKLLQIVRQENPNSYIIYKPHPDVTAGYRKKANNYPDSLKFVDNVITDISITSCIDACDEIHTMTSLSGFDALIRGKIVYTYGMPFYAGWGLTIDHLECSRRKRKLTLAELAYASLISYPIYFDLNANKKLEVEDVIQLIITQKNN